MSKLISGVLSAAFLLGGATGCSSTVRYMTATTWADGGRAAGTPAPADASGGSHVLYLTYWEGTCNSGVAGFGQGCSIGDSKIRRCNVQPDNGLACVDEAEATKAMAREK